MKSQLLGLLVCCPLLGSSILNSSFVDPSQFRVTQFATGLALPAGTLRTQDGALLAVTSPGGSGSQILRFTDTNADGVADGAPAVLYSNAQTTYGLQLRQGKELFYVAEFGPVGIQLLAPGANPNDPLTVVGSLRFEYPPGHGHPATGIAVRPTPGMPGHVDLVFNVGSEFNDQASVNPVKVSGLGLPETELAGDALYMVTIQEAGAVASNLRQIATGIRNVYGLGFHPETGDLYFADNAIDEANATGFTEPPQADELNRILLSQLGVEMLDFGYARCYPAYRTNVLVETTPGACNGVTTSVRNLQPLADGARSEGPTEIAFAPGLFPELFRGGVFVGFSGGVGPQGTNNQNPLVFVNGAGTSHGHMISPGTLSNILGLSSSADSLFVSSFGEGAIYQITALTEVPEPGTMGVAFAGLLAALWRRRIKAVSAERRACRRVWNTASAEERA